MFRCRIYGKPLPRAVLVVLLLAVAAGCAGCDWTVNIVIPLGLGGNVGVLNPLGVPSFFPVTSAASSLVTSLPFGGLFAF